MLLGEVDSVNGDVGPCIQAQADALGGRIGDDHNVVFGIAICDSLALRRPGVDWSNRGVAIGPGLDIHGVARNQRAVGLRDGPPGLTDATAVLVARPQVVLVNIEIACPDWRGQNAFPVRGHAITP